MNSIKYYQIKVIYLFYWSRIVRLSLSSACSCSARNAWGFWASPGRPRSSAALQFPEVSSKWLDFPCLSEEVCDLRNLQFRDIRTYVGYIGRTMRWQWNAATDMDPTDRRIVTSGVYNLLSSISPRNTIPHTQEDQLPIQFLPLTSSLLARCHKAPV